MNDYKVCFRTIPGMYAQYTSTVHVYAESDEDAVDRAFRKLKNGAFPDYSRSMWRVESVGREF